MSRMQNVWQCIDYLLHLHLMHVCCIELMNVCCRHLAKAPMTGEYDTDNVGRTPNTASEPVLEETAGKK
jgi:hypothetical protein